MTKYFQQEEETERSQHRQAHRAEMVEMKNLTKAQ